jgi:hypothetical protein
MSKERRLVIEALSFRPQVKQEPCHIVVHRASLVIAGCCFWRTALQSRVFDAYRRANAHSGAFLSAAARAGLASYDPGERDAPMPRLHNR